MIKKISSALLFGLFAVLAFAGNNAGYTNTGGALSTQTISLHVNAVGGSGITLSGSGFGTKPTAPPLRFNTFDSIATGTLATDASIGLQALGNNANYVPAVTTNRAHAGSKSLMLIYPTGADAVFPGTGLNLPAGTIDLYYGTWVYWEWTQGTTQSSFIFKWSRAGSNNNGGAYHGYPQYHTTVRPGSDGVVATGSDPHNCNLVNPGGVDNGYVSSTGSSCYDDTVAKSPSRDGWHWVEWKYRLSNPSGTTNGKYQWYVDGVVNGNLSSQITRASSDASTIDWWMSVFDGNDTYGTANEYRLYVDEMLVDTTMARVILTDNAIYSSSTKWAPQACSAWSNTSITIPAPNWGNLSSGSTAYFHVFDATDTEKAAISQVVP